MIRAYHSEHPDASVAFLCSVAQVNRSWFYDRPTVKEADNESVALRGRIEEMTLDMPGYGYRRVTAQLHKEGWTVNHKRILRIMRQESLLCNIKKRFIVTTDSNHGHSTYPNLLMDTILSGPNQAWQADITYVRLPGGFCYLAVLLDSFSRYLVGWHLSRHIDTRLALCALEKALVLRKPLEGLIHHSDRGVHVRILRTSMPATIMLSDWCRLRRESVCRGKEIPTTTPKRRAFSRR